jgi:DNA uptake protein ComE-like DNA-binding protein
LRIELNMKTLAFCGLMILFLAGCTPERHNPTPDEIRDQTAHATSTAARDAKAVAQGVVDGLKQQKGPMNINTASADDLKTLPGIDDDAAHRVIEGRPYGEGADLAKRHIVSHAEYERIASKITAR